MIRVGRSSAECNWIAGGCDAGGVGKGVGRTVTRSTRTCATISRRTSGCRPLFGTTPATISCSAIEIANARTSRRAFELPKKTPSRSGAKGSAFE
jgi:hypothetical protein